MEEKTKLTDDQKTENNEIVELKEGDISTITAGTDNWGLDKLKSSPFENCKALVTA